MWRLTLRSARAHWRRFVLTATAVVVGVAFVVGSFVLTDSLAGSIRSLLKDSAGRSDFVVRATDGRAGGHADAFGGSGTGVRESVAARLATVPGVAAADGVISGAAQLLDKAGRPGSFDFTLLSNWPTDPTLFGVALRSGRPPLGPVDVVVDTKTATDRRISLGDGLRVATRRGIIRATVTGLADQRGTGLVAAAPVLAFSTVRARELVGAPGWFGVVNIRLAPGADAATVQAELQRAGGSAVSVLRSDVLLARAQADVEEELRSFVGLLLGFAAVTLFVSAFLIWNTFTIVVAQRTRELALLRAVGASRRQVSASVIGEGLVVGAVASAIGLGLGVVLGIGLQNLVGALGVQLPATDVVVQPRTAVLGLAVGIGVTLVSVVGPARRATTVPPVAAIAAVDATPARRTLGRPVLGTVLLAVGLFVGSRALLSTGGAVDARVRTVALGALLVFLGVAGVARTLAGPIIGFIGAPFRYFGGVATTVAGRNAVRNPRRTASTASALMIGLALVATTLVVGESVRTAIRGGLTRSISADVVVDSGSVAPIDASTLEQIRDSRGVRQAIPLSVARSDTVDGGRLAVSTGDLARLTRVVDPEVVAGRLPAADDEIAVARRWAGDRGVRLGRRLTLTGGDTTRTLRVVGLYQRRELYGDSLAFVGALRGLVGVEPVTRLVFIDTVADVSPAAVADRLARTVAPIPNSSAKATPAFIADRTGSVDIILGIVNVLLLFAVLVAALGIANTLALSVVERTRELGLLRAVGMTRRRLRRMIRVEGVLISTFGGILGLVVGVGFGAALVGALPVETVEFTVPWLRLAGLMAIAAMLGIVAAALPARRAGRLDVLDALAEE